MINGTGLASELLFCGPWAGGGGGGGGGSFLAGSLGAPFTSLTGAGFAWFPTELCIFGLGGKGGGGLDIASGWILGDDTTLATSVAWIDFIGCCLMVGGKKGFSIRSHCKVKILLFKKSNASHFHISSIKVFM